MTGISAIMFFIATFHLAINCYRLIRGYADEHLTDYGPTIYFSDPRGWHHILKDCFKQHNRQIYRTWVLWSYDWKVIVLPIILLTVNIIVGYSFCAKLKSFYIDFHQIYGLIRTYYSIAFVLSLITVGLMSYRIWIAHRNAANY
ncbi:hypothetical protein BDQ17DRAFT_1216156, partial [Cyathus striatus]